MPFARTSSASAAGSRVGEFLQVFGGSHVQGHVGIVQKLYGTPLECVPKNGNINFESAEGEGIDVQSQKEV
eukprot:563218-Pelagomonas_calceolata.AAC.1